jgi:hypothetical protein
VLVYTHAAVPPELQGTLSPVAAGNTDRWVRLLSLYGGGLFENSVDDKGKFVLTGFAPGKYLLLLLDKDKIVSTQQLEILGGVKTVNISTIGQE